MSLLRSGAGLRWAPVFGALLLCACATTPPPSGKVANPSPPAAAKPVPHEIAPKAAPAPGQVSGQALAPIVPPAARRAPAPVISFASLPGWDHEDHAAALDMFRASCGAAKDPGLHEACLRARDLGPQDEVFARAFWETNFRVEAVGTDDGLLTGYFAPEYPARSSRQGPFTAPVRPRPADLPPQDVGAQTQTTPWLDRAAIEDQPERQPLAWMRPEDLFFLQIQGSGVLDFPDGRKLRAVYAANNGLPFVGIATPMRQRGILAPDNTSGEAIRQWLAANRGPDADEIMRLNPRYIFFTLQPWDGREPSGAAGVTLSAGRSLAVDPSQHAYGEVYWVDGEAPTLTGAFPSYRRLAMALDTGSAIKGQVRADLYMGIGEDAGAEAGRIKHRLKLYRLVPVADPTLAAAP